MGWQDRDYNRNSRSSAAFWTGSDGVTPVVKWILIANIVVFVSQILFNRDPAQENRQRAQRIFAELRQVQAEPNDPAQAEALRRLRVELAQIQQDLDDGETSRYSVVTKWCELDVDKVLHGQVWRLVTHAFCHDTVSPFHIIFNMLGLWWWGPPLERLRGSREFLLFYFACLLSGAFAYVGLELITGARSVAVGASAAVMGVVALYAYYYPTAVIYIFWVIPLEMRYAVIVWALIDLHPVLMQLSGRSFLSDGVGHSAHLGGMAFAFLYAWRDWHLSTLAEPLARLVQTWTAPRPRRRSNRNLRVFDPEAEPTGPRLMQPDDDDRRDRRDSREEELDEVLRRMHEVGRAGLSPAELAILEEASARLAKKRRPE
jgi:membrane associated rhomboid family serine protease